jgi:putative membrane protein
MEQAEDATHPLPLQSLGDRLAARRTGMAFQRTRLAADRTLMAVIRTSLSLISFGFTIFQFFRKLMDADVIRGDSRAAGNFGIMLVLIGVAVLALGIVYHGWFMLSLRRVRYSMTQEGSIYGESPFPPSVTLITAVLLLLLGLAAIISMTTPVRLFGL